MWEAGSGEYGSTFNVQRSTLNVQCGANGGGGKGKGGEKEHEHEQEQEHEEGERKDEG